MKAILDSILSRLDAIVRSETSADAPAPGFDDALQTLLAEPVAPDVTPDLEVAELDTANLEDADPDAALVLEAAPVLEVVDGGEEAVALLVAPAASVEDVVPEAEEPLAPVAADPLADLEAGRRPARLTSPDVTSKHRSVVPSAPAPSAPAPISSSNPEAPAAVLEVVGTDVPSSPLGAADPVLESPPTVETTSRANAAGPPSRTNATAASVPLEAPTSRTEVQDFSSAQSPEERPSLRSVHNPTPPPKAVDDVSSPKRSGLPESGVSSSPSADSPRPSALETARPARTKPALEVDSQPLRRPSALEVATSTTPALEVATPRTPVFENALPAAPVLEASTPAAPVLEGATPTTRVLEASRPAMLVLEDSVPTTPALEDAPPLDRPAARPRPATGTAATVAPRLDLESTAPVLEDAPASIPNAPAQGTALEVADAVERDLSQGRSAPANPAARRVLEDAEPPTVDAAEHEPSADLEVGAPVDLPPHRSDRPTRLDRPVEVLTSPATSPSMAAQSPAGALAASVALEDVNAPTMSTDGAPVDPSVPSISDASAVALGTAPEPSPTADTRVRAPLPTRLATPAWLDRVPSAGQDVRVSLGEDGAVRLQTVQDADGVTVSVRFTDPELQALAAAHAPRLRELLENHFEGAVRLSLDSAGPDANADGHARDGAPARPRRDAPRHAENTPIASPRPRLAAAQSGREWIG